MGRGLETGSNATDPDGRGDLADDRLSPFRAIGEVDRQGRGRPGVGLKPTMFARRWIDWLAWGHAGG
jgi:hypothetical protein